MRTRIFIPPLPRMSGGLAVLYRLASHLHRAGHDVALVPRDTAPCLDDAARELPVVQWESIDLSADDLWLVPEGWINALAPGLKAGARNVVYVQNWAYLLSALPSGVQWPQLDVSFMAVSDPVAWFTRETTGREAVVLRPGIDTNLFHPANTGSTDACPPRDRVRVCWMPRKNKALAIQIRAILEARLSLAPPCGSAGPLPVEWVEIHGMQQPEVAAALRSAHIFLATGFPEGCPLPPLEALASGALVVGFAGMGGWDYMRQAMPGGYLPWYPLREVPWGGNGLYAADADVTGAAFALEHAIRMIAAADPRVDTLRQAGLHTAATYDLAAQRDALLTLWARAAEGDLFHAARRP